MFDFHKIRHKFGSQDQLSHRGLSQQKFRSLVFLFSFLSLMLRIAIPPVVLTGTTHDDELMIRLASQIMKGNWLGDYSTLGHLTLAKPAGFPMFLAATSWLPWSQVVSVHMILILAIILFVREFRMLGLNRFSSLVMLTYLLFFPRWFDDYMSRIYREGLLTAITLLFISMTLVVRRNLVVSDLPKNRYTRIFQLLNVFAAGLLFGSLVLIKISWQPALLMFVVLIGLQFGRSFKQSHSFKYLANNVLLIMVPVVIGASLPIVTVSSLNYSRYGLFTLENYRGGEFARSISLLSSIEPSGTRPYVQVTAAQRSKVYEISPTFALLRPYLEQPDGTGWRGAACSHVAICDESAGWFPWDLRDAVQIAGLAGSATEFESTFRKISDEIDLACHSKIILCGVQGLAPGIGDPFDIPVKYLIDGQFQAVSLLFDLPTGNGTRRIVDGNHPAYPWWRAVVPGIEPWSGVSGYQPNNYGLGDTQALLNRFYQQFWMTLLILALIGLLIPKRCFGAHTDSCFRNIGFAGFSGAFVGTSLLALLEATSGAYVTDAGNFYSLPLFPLVLLFMVSGLIRMGIAISGRFKVEC
jgi:hypothetical protein